MIIFLCLATVTVFIIFILIKISESKFPSDDVTKETLRIPNKKDVPSNRSLAKEILKFILICSVFWSIGIAMIAGSFMLKAKEERYINNGKPVNAVISDIVDHEVSDSDGNYEDVRDVYLHYTVNETEYDNVLKDAGLYGIAVGEKLKIYCSENDPTDFICPKQIKNKLSFTFPAGVILTVLPFGLYLAGKITSKKSNR